MKLKKTLSVLAAVTLGTLATKGESEDLTDEMDFISPSSLTTKEGFKKLVTQESTRENIAKMRKSLSELRSIDSAVGARDAALTTLQVFMGYRPQKMSKSVSVGSIGGYDLADTLGSTRQSEIGKDSVSHKTWSTADLSLPFVDGKPIFPPVLATPEEQKKGFSVGFQRTSSNTRDNDFKAQAGEVLLNKVIDTIDNPLLSLASCWVDVKGVAQPEHISKNAFVGQFNLDGGDSLRVSIGKVPLMEGFSSTGMITNNRGHERREQMNVDATISNAICFEHATKEGAITRIGYAENTKSGPLFNYNGTNSEFFVVGSKKALEDKLQLSGGVRLASDLGGITGMAAIKFTPDKNTQFIAELVDINGQDMGAMLSFAKNFEKVYAALSVGIDKKTTTLEGLVQHKETGLYGSVSADTKGDISANVGIRIPIGR